MKIPVAVVALLIATTAQAAQQPLTEITTKQSRQDLRTAVNSEFAKAQLNFTEIYTALNGSPWLAQTTAPNTHNVFWIDTSATTRVIKYWDGDSWEVAASGGDGTYTLPTASTETKGGVKIGARLTMTGEVLSADVQTTDISGKQDTLVSGTNIKTVNGTSVLGSGNLVVDQDLSGYALTSSVLSKTNTTAFTPTADYHPVPKKYVDDSITASGGYTDEQAQDAAGTMFSGNTETGITVTYDDATGKVNFVVPTTLAGFTDDSTHRVVTDTEKSTWNAKQNALVAGTDYLAPTGIGASLTFTATGFNGNLATTINTVQELADAVDDLSGGSDDQTAAEVPITDSGGYYTATTVEGALAERGADPLIHWDTATITEVENSPLAGTNTISVKSGVFQAYDADWLGITANGASLISAANYAAMRALLDLEAGTDFNAYDADLTTYAGITPSANAQSLLSSANYAAMRVLLDLEVGTDFNAYDADIADLADGSLTGSKVSGYAAATNSKATTYTIGTDSVNESYGGAIYVTSATTITAPAVVTGMNFSVVTVGDIAVSLDVNAADKMILDGVTLADGDKATNSSKSGDTIVCQYYSVDGWYCWSGTVLGGHWTDGN